MRSVSVVLDYADMRTKKLLTIQTRCILYIVVDIVNLVSALSLTTRLGVVLLVE